MGMSDIKPRAKGKQTLKKLSKRKSATQNTQVPQMWWEGGTLHDADIGKFWSSPIHDQEATMADIVCTFKDKFRTNFHFQNPSGMRVYVLEIIAVIANIAQNDPNLHWIKVIDAAYVAACNLNYIADKQPNLQQAIEQAESWRELVESNGITDIPEKIRKEKLEAQIKANNEANAAMLLELEKMGGK